jgi:hypothetical protein
MEFSSRKAVFIAELTLGQLSVHSNQFIVGYSMHTSYVHNSKNIICPTQNTAVISVIGFPEDFN